jgi:hypothetical protein
MRARLLIVLLTVAAIAGTGCAASELKARKDNSWRFVSHALPDSYDPSPTGYDHVFRDVAFVLYPVGKVLDYVLFQPFYMLAGLGPEWFGLTVQDGQDFQAHFPELAVPRESPRLFERF